MISAWILAVLAVLPLELETVREGSFAVETHDVDGELHCTLRARRASIEAVVADLALKGGRNLQGLGNVAKTELFDADLEARPYQQVVLAVLGCAGLRARVTANTIEIVPDVDASASTEDLDQQAELSWLRALRAFPEAESAAAGEFALAEIQLRRSNLGAARLHLESLVRNHVHSDLLPGALLELGLVLQKLGEWSDAATHFSALANLQRAHDHQARARLELARCYAYRGDGKQALSLLDALDSLFPAPSNEERMARLYVRAPALSAAGQHALALQALDDASVLAFDQAYASEALRLRADALEHVGLAADAARAWLAFAEKAKPAERSDALLRAARSALEAQDAVAVLFIQRMALGSPAAQPIEALVAEARELFGLEGDKPELSSTARLARARELLATRAFAQVALVLEPLFSAREHLSEAELTELAEIQAHVFDNQQGLEAALGLLRTITRELRELENRKRLYVLGGELCEARGEWDRAVEAYGGRL